jgi:hypothetical protein
MNTVQIVTIRNLNSQSRTELHDKVRNYCALQQVDIGNWPHNAIDVSTPRPAPSPPSSRSDDSFDFDFDDDFFKDL